MFSNSEISLVMFAIYKSDAKFLGLVQTAQRILEHNYFGKKFVCFMLRVNKSLAVEPTVMLIKFRLTQNRVHLLKWYQPLLLTERLFYYHPDKGPSNKGHILTYIPE